MAKKFFEGWYYKQQNQGKTLALIPGHTGDGAFIQVVTGDRAYNIDYPASAMQKDGDVVQIGQNRFSRHGIEIDIKAKELSLQGKLSYTNLSSPAYDIMGPFRFFPMECRHSVISMDHAVFGTVTVNGEDWDFHGGRGYIEGDRGRSFPSSYSWVQCNAFDVPCSVMVSVAHIPFGCLHFTGCISTVWYDGQEYRLATYRGVHILRREQGILELQQGPLRLYVEMEKDPGHPLFAPAKGSMSRKIHETPTGTARFRFWVQDRLLFDKTSSYASFEYVK